MPNTKPNKYNEVAENIQALYHQGVYVGETEKISAILRPAFPPPAEDARQLVEDLFSYEPSADEDEKTISMSEAAVAIESFAQSRVEPWREALKKYGQHLIGCDFMKGWPYHPERKVCTCGLNALLSDSPAKEDTL